MCGVIEFSDPKYPSLLKEIPDPPRQLFYKGTYDLTLLENCLGVVGSRHMSIYGKQVVRHLLADFHNVALTVVSGFMYGVDACAHKWALEYNIPTIAVLPCGIDLIHPSNQRTLYENILNSGGLILSEYPGVTPPQVWTYPKRNRIVAGLSRAVLIVEAATKSGSLITANLAHKFGREVFAVPGNIFSKVSKGTFELISTFAIPVATGESVIKRAYPLLESALYSVKPERTSVTSDDLERTPKDIVCVLKEGPRTLDELAEEFNSSIPVINLQLASLQLEGLVEEVGGRYCVF
jgi:DNA processing protein